jgi:hypothetical protein
MPLTSISWIEKSWEMDRRSWKMDIKSREIDKLRWQQHSEEWTEVHVPIK